MTRTAPAPQVLTQWHVVHGGPQHGVMLRKLERAGGFKAVDVQVERLLWQGRQEAHTRFALALPAQPIDALHQALLQLAWRLAPTWRVTRSGDDLAGEWRDDADGPAAHGLPGGCWQVRWAYQASQSHVRTLFLNGQPNHW